MIFPTDYTVKDTVRRANHGKIWTDDERTKLRLLFLAGCTLKEMCEELQRPAEGVISKLENRGLIRKSGAGNWGNQKYEISSAYVETVYAARQQRLKAKTTDSSTTEEPTMNDNTPTIETKTFIQGEDASNMTDAQIFNRIAKLEDEIDKLSKIKNQPKKLQALIQTKQDDINKLIEFVDARP